MQTRWKIGLSLFLFLSRCAPITETTDFVSGIDQQYRLKKATQSTGSLSNFTLDLYASSLTNVVGSPCMMFPSDSYQARILQNKCGPAVSILREIDRVYLEPGAPELKTSVIRGSNGFLYVDLPEDCSLY